MSMRKHSIPKRVRNWPVHLNRIIDIVTWPRLGRYPRKKKQFVQVGNKHVLETIKKYRKRKRGNFSHFTPESRAKIAKWACEYGYTSAAKRFSKELMRDVNESTVRLIKKNSI